MKLAKFYLAKVTSIMSMLLLKVTLFNSQLDRTLLSN